MRYDQYGFPIYNPQDLFELIYQNKFELFNTLLVDTNQETEQFERILGFKLSKPNDQSLSITDFDNYSQSDWFMPNEYKNFNIEEFLISICPQHEKNLIRLNDELNEFKKRNLLDLLRWLKYFVDHSIENNILWGVGRGSSVASYVLFLIGVHHIDSIKYNLDWQDFLR